MRLAINVSYLGSGLTAENTVGLAIEADRLGCHSVWVAEAYGSDAPSLLSWIGARTSRIRLGTAIMQMTARSPAMTAMTAATLDLLSEGRMLLGLGLSGPQVAEGWHGTPYTNPLRRTREYVEIIRMALKRDVLDYDGQVYKLPLPESEGKPLKLIIHPHRSDIPIYLAAIGPANVSLAGEIADGWLPIFFSPEQATYLVDELKQGLTRSVRDAGAVDIAPTVMVSMGASLEDCFDMLRPAYGLYLGGMGSSKSNFYFNLASRYGFEDACLEIQKKYMEGDRVGAMSAVPSELIDETALVGPPGRVVERAARYREAGVTTLIANPVGSLTERVATIGVLAKALVG